MNLWFFREEMPVLTNADINQPQLWASFSKKFTPVVKLDLELDWDLL